MRAAGWVVVMLAALGGCKADPDAKAERPVPADWGGMEPDPAPPACRRYADVIDRLTTECPHYPKLAADTMVAAFAKAKAGWQTYRSMTPDQQQAIAAACTASADSVVKAAKPQCGW